MRQTSRRQWAFAGVVSVLMMVGVGCADQVVYRDRGFAEPPATAKGFLGFADNSNNETVCGNCHVGHQAAWEQTGHADAWEPLVASGRKQAFCEGCHATGDKGSAFADSTSGWAGTKDARYHDVQCESCHGPGLEHAMEPDRTGNIPQASIAISTTGPTTGCAECHNGAHHPFVEEWRTSGHASFLASPAGRPECQGCHTAKGTLDAWGVTANYVEKNNGQGHVQMITCAVCHDPHSNEASRRIPGTPGATPGSAAGVLRMPSSGGQLRFPADVPNEEQNLCMKCHHKRGRPDLGTTNNSRGPHSPEGPLLLGENVGNWFDGMPSGDAAIVGSHGPESNPRLCATCHMQRFEVTDKVTGAFKIGVVGHTFDAIPCVDGNGQPTGSHDCEITARSFKSCTGSGCHGTENAARSAMTTVNNRVAVLAAEVDRLVNLVRATEVKSTDGKWTSAEGADWNRQLAVFPGSSIHNPFMIEALLLGSIQEMKKRYSLDPLPTLDLGAKLATPAHLKGRLGTK